MIYCLFVLSYIKLIIVFGMSYQLQETVTKRDIAYALTFGYLWKKIVKFW